MWAMALLPPPARLPADPKASPRPALAQTNRIGSFREAKTDPQLRRTVHQDVTAGAHHDKSQHSLTT